MLTRLTDFDRSFDVLDELRRQMNRVWDDFDGTWGIAPPASQSLSGAAWPRFNVFDAGTNFVVTADVPGLTENDLELTLEDGVLSIRGERRATPPEGYAVHRRERGSLKFARSVALPVKVDGEKTTASVKDGVLTITLAKAPEARPLKIAVRAQG